MERQKIETNLALAEKHVKDGERHIRDQSRIIEELQQNGSDISQAQKLLGSMNDLQTVFVRDRDRLAAELASAK